MAAMMRCAALRSLRLLLALPAAAQEAAGAKPHRRELRQEPAKHRQAADSGDAQNSICLLLESAARANDLPVEFFARVIWQESRFRADAVGPVTRSGKRALGIAQFMPGTAAERNLLNPLDPIQALPKSAEFLRELRARVRQSRSCRRGLQRRAEARSRLDGGHWPDAGGDAQLCAVHHRRFGRAMGQGVGATPTASSSRDATAGN